MLPAPPYDFTPLRDFRRKGSASLGTAAVFTIRELQEKQAWVHDWYVEQGEKPVPFVGRFSLRNSPATVAADMLKELGIQPPHYSDPMKDWLAKAEVKGIFISRSSYIHSRMTLDRAEFQGFAIADPVAPFIFINTEDWRSAQLFTLVHELAHLWLAQTGISSDVSPSRADEKEIDPVERFCNQAAAIALMPEDFMNTIPGAAFDAQDEVNRLAKMCGVSSLAFLIRARQLDLLSVSKFDRLKKDADVAFRSYVEKEEARQLAAKQRGGGPDPYRMRTYRNGLSFSRLVMDAFRGGVIPPTLASRLLRTRINDFTKMEKFAYP
jgi:Zn-dependent peptidase ImmA (M78 family)